MKLPYTAPILLLVGLLLLVACSLIGTAAAHVEGDYTSEPGIENENVETGYDDYMSQEESDDRLTGVAGTIFQEIGTVGSPVLHAGTKTQVVMAYRNTQPGHLHTIILASGYLTRVGMYNHVVQNFSIVRHARTVLPSDTVSFHYSFTPDDMLEPEDYNLILGFYHHDNITNGTRFISAFNGTVTIDESLGTDPKTIMTCMTLLALLGGSLYLLASKFGLMALLKSKRGGGSSRRRVEVGTNGEGYDPEYVSQEHQRYRDAILQRNSSSSPVKKR